MRKLKYLAEYEKKELFNEIDRDTSIHATRNKAIFYIAKYCALRVSEIGLIKLEDYNTELAQIYCRRMKGSYSNTIRILDQDVLTKMNNYLVERKAQAHGSEYLFISQRGNPISRKMLDVLMKKYCQNTSIPKEKRHFHVLKHTRAIELGDCGLDLKDIQWWLGHANIKNTQIYAQFTTYQQSHLYEKLIAGRKEYAYKKS